MKPPHLRWLLACAVVAAAIWAYTVIAATGRTRPTHAAATAARSEPPARPAAPERWAAVSSSERVQHPRSAYGSAIREGMFSAPQAASKPLPSAGPPVREHPPVVPSMPPPDLLADAEYAGSYTVNGETLALVESRTTHQGEYVAAGGQWQGLRITAITPQQLTLSVNGGVRTIPVSDRFNAVHLTASAATAQPNATPGAAQPAGAGVAQAGGMAEQTAAMMMRRAEAKAMQSAGMEMRMKAMEMDYKSKLSGAVQR